MNTMATVTIMIPKEKDEIVKISVGGTRFMTLRSTLTAVSDSMLARKFATDSPFGAPLLDDEGYVFIDRNPDTFPYVLDYLRNGCRLVYPPPVEMLLKLKADAEYYGLAGLVETCTKKLLRKKKVVIVNEEMKKGEAEIRLENGSWHPLSSAPCGMGTFVQTAFVVEEEEHD